MADVLGKKEDAEFYKQKAERIKYAYDRYLIGEDGTIQKGHQAAYVRALAYDMVSEEKKPLVIQQLKKEIDELLQQLQNPDSGQQEEQQEEQQEQEQQEEQQNDRQESNREKHIRQELEEQRQQSAQERADAQQELGRHEEGSGGGMFDGKTW